MLKEPERSRQFIDYAGGGTKLARELGVSPQRVSNWRRRGIPPVWWDVLKLKRKLSTAFNRIEVHDECE